MQNHGRPEGPRCTLPSPVEVRALALRLWGVWFSLVPLVPHPPMGSPLPHALIENLLCADSVS